MERGWKQLVATLILGFLMPQLMLHIGSPADIRQPQPTVAATEPSTPPATAVPQQPTAPDSQTLLYIPVQTGEGTVRIMELESYILGVVLAEMPASFEQEALKAQAVVARSYTLRRLTLGDRHGAAAVCTDPGCCQAYISETDYLICRGTQRDLRNIADAVEQTRGLVLSYGGELAEATYFSCSGGRTEDAAAVWGSHIPYLRAVDSPGEEGAESFEHRMYMTAAQIRSALGRQLSGSPESWLGKVTYTDGGGVASMVIGGISYSGTELRQRLGLNSTAFSMTADSGGITVTTRGKGHRVGMSQYGADAMAVTGSGFREILAHYYPGTEIDKFPVIG